MTNPSDIDALIDKIQPSINLGFPIVIVKWEALLEGIRALRDENAALLEQCNLYEADQDAHDATVDALQKEIERVTDIAKRRMAWLNWYKGMWNESDPDARQPLFAAKEDEL